MGGAVQQAATFTAVTFPTANSATTPSTGAEADDATTPSTGAEADHAPTPGTSTPADDAPTPSTGAEADHAPTPGTSTPADDAPTPSTGAEADHAPTPSTGAQAARAASAGTPAPQASPAPPDLFARHIRAYAAGRPGQQVAILAAGCTTGRGLGPAALRPGDSDVSVTMIDDDQPATRAAAAGADLNQCTLGDLRTIPLAPRAFDIVTCASLLERIRNAELVLDRLIAAIKPGGLLLLRICDRDSAAGFLERVLPAFARRAVWRRRRPGEPGPHPAVYEQLASARGVQAYALLRGLVVTERLALGGVAGGLPPGPPGFLGAQRLIARLSRGKITDAHEELLYVLRKPENRFARIV